MINHRYFVKVEIKCDKCNGIGTYIPENRPYFTGICKCSKCKGTGIIIKEVTND